LFEVQEGVIEIVDGRTFTAAEMETVDDVHPVVISRGLAELNHLSVGSTFEIPLIAFLPQLGNSWDPTWYDDPDNIFSEEMIRFEVIGTFDLAPDASEGNESNDDFMAEMFNFERVNTFFLPNTSAEMIQRFQDESRREAATYLIERDGLTPDDILGFDPSTEHETSVTSMMELHDSQDLESFRAAAEPLLPDFWEIEDLSNTFDDISSSMETLQGIANWILWVSLGATLIILSLIITLFLRDRRYEMGVYLALGEKKSKVVSQVLIEVVTTAIEGITLAVFTGSIISNTMARTMLRNELTAEQSNHTNMSFGVAFGEQSLESMGFAEEMSPEAMIEAFDVSLDGGTIGLFYIIGLGAVILGTVAPVMYIVTLNPKKVLMG